MLSNIYIKNNINHLYMCMPIYLKMVTGKYLGKLDIPIYNKVINKLNAGIYYKWPVLYIPSYNRNEN